jgi:type I restriction enzyme S subunit
MGGTRTRLYYKNLCAYRTIFPPLTEQQKIAEILSAQDKLIALKEKLIEEKKRQKKALMQQLLTGKKRLPGFNDEWKPTKLKKLLKERKTYSQKGLEYPHVTLSTDGIYAKTERYDREHLVKSEDKEYKITHKGDICYNPANLKFGVICVNTFGDAIFSPIYVTFEVQKGVDLGFLSNYLMRWDFINAVRKYEEGTVYERMAVKPEDFLKFEIKLPSIEEQKAISKILSLYDSEIELLKNDLDQEKQKKKALMQLLLTGIVRV